MSADIDECETGSNICSENAACFNGFGSYECHCLPGFNGDAHNCTGEGREAAIGNLLLVPKLLSNAILCISQGVYHLQTYLSTV